MLIVFLDLVLCLKHLCLQRLHQLKDHCSRSDLRPRILLNLASQELEDFEDFEAPTCLFVRRRTQMILNTATFVRAMLPPDQ